jgi:hydrogenase 3 maturation protease
MDQDWKARLEAEWRGARRIVLLGVGNAGKGDDGAGPLCTERVRRALPAAAVERILVVDGGEVPESQTGPIRKFGPDLTVIVDAAVGGHAPGTVFIVEKEGITDDEVSTHRISLLYLVRYLEESIGSKVLILGIEPADLNAGETISAPVQAAIILIAEFFNEILSDRDCV